MYNHNQRFMHGHQKCHIVCSVSSVACFDNKSYGFVFMWVAITTWPPYASGLLWQPFLLSVRFGWRILRFHVMIPSSWTCLPSASHHCAVVPFTGILLLHHPDFPPIISMLEAYPLQPLHNESQLALTPWWLWFHLSSLPTCLELQLLTSDFVSNYFFVWNRVF